MLAEVNVSRQEVEASTYVTEATSWATTANSDQSVSQKLRTLRKMISGCRLTLTERFLILRLS